MKISDILKYLNALGWVIAIILAICLKSCDKTEQYKALLISKNDTLQTYKDKHGQLVSQIQAIKLDRDVFKEQAQQVPALQKQLASAQITIKNLTSITTAYTSTDIKKTLALKNDTHHFDANDSMILDRPYAVHDTLFKKSFADSNRFYKITGEVGKDSVAIKFHSSDSITLITGDKKPHLFGKPIFTITAQNSNPYVTIKNLSNYTIMPKVPWYNSTLFKIGLGVAGGIFIERELLKAP
jgi:uncharacterized lipoprotein YehR (DUF1307 family)